MSVGDGVFRPRPQHPGRLRRAELLGRQAAMHQLGCGGRGRCCRETAKCGLRLLGVKAGDTLFVDGGAGGVGSAAVQMAVAEAYG